jgi:hypothetical protein
LSSGNLFNPSEPCLFICKKGITARTTYWGCCENTMKNHNSLRTSAKEKNQWRSLWPCVTVLFPYLYHLFCQMSTLRAPSMSMLISFLWLDKIPEIINL